MNHDALRQLCRVRPGIRELFEWISTHGVVEWRMAVEQLIKDTSLTRRQAISALRELESHDCGQFKVGRKGHASRFEWSVDPSVLAARLCGQQDEEPHEEPTTGTDEAIEADEPAVDAELERLELELEGSSSSAAISRYMIGHAYVLRHDLRVEVQLPADLTPREAEVLSAWLRDLSFER